MAGWEGPSSPLLVQPHPIPAGLEPEIQKLIAKHKQEVRRLRGLHEAELQQREEQATQRQLRQAEELREHLEREREVLGQQERERAQLR